MTITTCPSCGSQAIRRVQRDWIGEYQGTAYTVPALNFYECPECEEKVYDHEAMRTIERYSPAFKVAVSGRKNAVRKRTKKSRAVPQKEREKV